MMTATLQPYLLLDHGGAMVQLNLELLGESSSWKERKTNWFEVALYRDADGRFIVHTVGRTNVVGETDRGRVQITESEFDVVELLTVFDRKRNERFIPRDSMRALAQAAARDDKIRNAYLKLAA